MPTGLQHLLNLGGESLSNSRFGIEVTGHNISNAQTPGYSRQRAEVEAKQPAQYGNLILGQGARVARVERAHNKYLEDALRRETQKHGQAEALDHNLGRLQSFFNPDLTSTVRSRMDTFVNALRDFSNMPDEPAARSNLIESANSFTNSINATHANVVNLQNDITQELSVDCDMATQTIAEIANLNKQIMELKLSEDSRPNDLEDRRDVALAALSKLMDVQTYTDERGQFTVRGAGGELLVEGIYAAEVKVDFGANTKNPQIMLTNFEGKNPKNISNGFRAGKLSGMIEARDKHAQRIRDDLNQMAQTFGNRFNQIHRMGYGRAEFADSNGRDFFEGIADPSKEPAQLISVSTLIQQDANAVAGGITPMSPGDNILANELIRTVKEPIFADGTASMAMFYDNFVADLGSTAMTTKNELKASAIVKANVETQKERISGVSLDEEAANMLKYQHMFAASSKIISAADEMFKTVLDLRR